MTDVRIITIVHLRRYVHGEEAINLLDEQLRSPKASTALLLVPEDANAHAPNRAVAAYAGSQKVGYVTETDIPYARTAIGDNMALEVEYDGLNEERTALLATVEYEMEQVQVDYTPLFTLPPVNGIPFPRFNVAHDLLCAKIMTYAATTPWEGPEAMAEWEAQANPEHPIYELAREFAEQYGSSLSGDDMRVYSLLMETTALPADILEKMQTAHHHFVATEAHCLNVWQKECRQANKILTARNGLWQQISVQLNAHTSNPLRLSREMRNALVALPYDLFALHEKKPQLFASRLYHLHLSSEELDALKTYLIIYEKVRLKKANLYKEKPSASLFIGDEDDHSMQAFKHELHKYISKTNRQSFVPGLVALIVSGEKKGFIPRNLRGNVSSYCKTLMAVYSCEFDIPNFRKLYRQSKPRL